MQDEFGQLPSDVARPLRRQQQPTSASRSSRGHRRPPPLPSGAASPDHLVLLRSSDMEAWESESPMAAVTLPSRPPPMPPSMASGSSVGGPLPLPPRGSSSHSRPARPPPMLGRTSSLPLNQGGGPPVVPPRPESTLTSNSRRIQPSSASQQQHRQQSSRHPEGPKPKSQLRPTQSLVPPSQPAVINPDLLVALPVTTRPLDERIPRVRMLAAWNYQTMLLDYGCHCLIWLNHSRLRLASLTSPSASLARGKLPLERRIFMLRLPSAALHQRPASKD